MAAQCAFRARSHAVGKRQWGGLNIVPALIALVVTIVPLEDYLPNADGQTDGRIELPLMVVATAMGSAQCRRCGRNVAAVSEPSLAENAGAPRGIKTYA